MDKTTGPTASPLYSMAQSAQHQVLVCKACRHKGDICKPGFHLLKTLRAAIQAAGLGTEFEVSGTACLADCAPAQRGPCVVGYRATEKGTWLFGDIDRDQPLDELIEFARDYAALYDAWMNGRDVPSRLRDTTLARIPAAMIVTREGAIQ